MYVRSVLVSTVHVGMTKEGHDTHFCVDFQCDPVLSVESDHQEGNGIGSTAISTQVKTVTSHVLRPPSQMTTTVIFLQVIINAKCR